ncbi:MAG: response regulator transcription factor [Winogradskyella sp.]|nr:response regulator transcription factor [Winogradskyella sp.]MBT8376179.1 response regulator transcription factor [Bacteroidia bacterium]NNC45517.1 response regulator transcription factor [Winogradskyella sp.]NNF86517.1 response regulator transcription factor [Winogradskyella sp.]NNK40643.1 response regulator transcription factor [Winogradskyella sp.]
MTKILIVDSHPIVRKGLESFLDAKPDFDVVGSLNSGIEIFDFVRHNKVDVIISEVDLPELNGITALRAVKKENKNINVLMFSHQPEEIYAISTLKAGASGYLNKTADLESIEKAVRKISSGEVSLSEKMDKHLRYEDTRKSRTRLFKRLSTREVEVLKLLSIGRKNKEIAEELSINEKTVSTYKARLFKKLNVTNIVDLINQAKHHDLA